MNLARRTMEREKFGARNRRNGAKTAKGIRFSFAVFVDFAVFAFQTPFTLPTTCLPAPRSGLSFHNWCHPCLNSTQAHLARIANRRLSSNRIQRLNKARHATIPSARLRQFVSKFPQDVFPPRNPI